MKKLIFQWIFLGSAAFLPVTGKEPGQVPAHSAFSAGHNHFAFSLLNAVLHQDGSRRNIAVSPLGIYLSLGMLYNAADHATRDSIAEALGTAGFGGQNLNSLCRDLMQDMSQQDERSEIVLANSLWCNRHKGPVSPAFENICESYFYSPVRSVNFASRSTAGLMNKWVDQSTRHRIVNVVPAVDGRDQICLVNAMSFRCDWCSPFDTGDTKEDVFFLAGGRARSAFFMKKEMVAKTYSDTSFTMVQLPYGNGRAYGLYLVQPDDQDISIREFMAGFTESRMYEAISKMNDRWISLSLPRWEYSYSPEDMGPVLRKMGMGILLNDYSNTDLSMMCRAGVRRQAPGINDLLAGRTSPRLSQSLCLSKAFCMTRIAVNEQGAQVQTPKGSVTKISPDSTYPIRRHQVQTIRMDRPFFYAIISAQQQAILMAGIVNDPGKDH